MSSRKKTKPPVVREPRVEEPKREPYKAAWYHNRYSDVQHSTTSISTLVGYVMEGQFRLPKFQRSWVWTDEQVIRLFDSLVKGFHVGSLLLWERYKLPPSVEKFGDISVDCPGGHPYGNALIVDGQQRVASLVMLAHSGRFWVDLEAGTLVTTPGPWHAPSGHFTGVHTLSDNLYWPEEHAAEHGLDPLKVHDYWIEMAWLLQRTYISAVRLGSDWTLERVMETFRRINTEGTQMDPVLLEEALRRAQEDPGMSWRNSGGDV